MDVIYEAQALCFSSLGYCWLLRNNEGLGITIMYTQKNCQAIPVEV